MKLTTFSPLNIAGKGETIQSPCWGKPTLPETNIAPESLGLEDEFPFGFRPIFRCELLVLGRVLSVVFSVSVWEGEGFHGFAFRFKITQTNQWSVMHRVSICMFFNFLAPLDGDYKK